MHLKQYENGIFRDIQLKTNRSRYIFSEEYIVFKFLKSQFLKKGQFRKSPGLIRPMPAV
jgi:hypothetical protein